MLRSLRARSRFIVRSIVALSMAATFMSGLIGGMSVARAQTDPGFVVGEAVVVDTTSVNFRADATTSAGTISVLIDGTYGEVAAGPTTADGYVWYKLDVDGTSGWVAADYLQSASGSHGVIPAGSTAIVTTDFLNLRATPSTTGAVVTTIANGDRPAVNDGPTTADGYEWYQLTINGETGWAVRNYLAFAPQDIALLAAGDVAAVNTDTLNLRDAAGLSGAIINVLGGGAMVTILDGPVTVDGWIWYQVDDGTETGWVAAEYLTV